MADVRAAGPGGEAPRLRALLGGAGESPEPGSYDIRYVTGAGLCRVTPAEAGTVPFETALPVRGFVSYKGQRNYPGRWWTATVGAHIGYESWLERDHLMLLDFDAAVAGIASQPFWLSWTTPAGKTRSHAPDFFARHGDGSAVVVDCRPLHRIKPKDAAKFDATRQVCEQLGWQYRVVGAPDAIVVGNVRWLAGYRHPRHERPDVARLLLAVFAEPVALMVGAEAAGDPIAVLPVLFHLLWRHQLVADLSLPLHEGTQVLAVQAAA